MAGLSTVPVILGKATKFVHFIWKEHVRMGDVLIDATCGQGLDTVALTNLVLPPTPPDNPTQYVRCLFLRLVRHAFVFLVLDFITAFSLRLLSAFHFSGLLI